MRVLLRITCQTVMGQSTMKMHARNSRVSSKMENLMGKTASFTMKKGAENMLAACKVAKNMAREFCMRKMGSRFMRVNLLKIR
jgi:acetylornithine/succinyldiaminopimelate/putrescine aminotransferase